MSVSGKVLNATTIRCYWEALNGPMSGNVKFLYNISGSGNGSITVEDDNVSVLTSATTLNFANGVGTRSIVADAGSNQADIVFDQYWTEEQVSSGGSINNKSLAAPVGVQMYTANGPALSGIVSSGRERGTPLFIHYRGVNFVELANESASSTDVNRFDFQGDHNMRMTADEVAMFIPIDVAPGATDTKRWACVSHRAPFYNYAGLDAGDTIQHDGSDWQTVSQTTQVILKRRVMQWSEDFEYCPTSGSATTTGATLGFGNTNWFLQGTVATCTYSQRTPEANHPGVFAVTTGNTNGDGFQFHRGVEGNIGAGCILGSDVGIMEGVVQFSAITTIYFHMGYADTLAANTNSILIYFDTTASANWRIYCSSAGVATDTDTGIPAAAGWTALRIHRTGSSNVDFYVEDVLVGSITTNIPGAVDLSPVFRGFTRTASTRRFDFDYVSMTSAALNARTA